MATSTTVNAQLIKYDASGNQTIINPKTLAQDVTITANTNKSSITNLQSLITALGSLAFQSYTIVTSLSSAKSGTLVDGGVIADLNTTLTDLQSEVTSMSSIDVFTGATSNSDGTAGIVPAPLAGEEEYFLCADGTWKEGGMVYISTDSYITTGTIELSEYAVFNNSSHDSNGTTNYWFYMNTGTYSASYTFTGLSTYRTHTYSISSKVNAYTYSASNNLATGTIAMSPSSGTIDSDILIVNVTYVVSSSYSWGQTSSKAYYPDIVLTLSIAALSV